MMINKANRETFLDSVCAIMIIYMIYGRRSCKYEWRIVCACYNKSLYNFSIFVPFHKESSYQIS